MSTAVKATLAVATFVVAVLALSPETIRRLPELPTAVTETVGEIQKRRSLEVGLSSDWVLGTSVFRQLILSTHNDGGVITGEVRGPKLTLLGAPLGAAFVDGKVAGQWIYVDLYDIREGRRFRLARLEARFQRPVPGSQPPVGPVGVPGPVVVDDPDHPWKIVDDELEVHVFDQTRPILDEVFTLRREKVSKEELDAYDAAAASRWFRIVGGVAQSLAASMAARKAASNVIR